MSTVQDITKLQIHYKDINTPTTEDLIQVLNSINNQYKRCIEIQKLAIASGFQKLKVSQIKTSSLLLDLTPWVVGSLMLMNQTNTVVSFLQHLGVLKPLLDSQNPFQYWKDYFKIFRKQDLLDFMTISTLNKNDSPSQNLKIGTVNLYGQTNVYNSLNSEDINGVKNKLGQIMDQIPNQILSKTENLDNAFEKEYGDEKLIKGLLIEINWNTNRGLIRAKLFESERARQYKFRIVDSRERPENITPRTHLRAQATPVFNEGSDVVQELELRAVECSYEN